MSVVQWKWMRQCARGGVLALLIACSAAVAWASDKRGIGISDRSAPERIEALKATWYYTWSPVPVDGKVKAEFVPMVWNGAQLQKYRLDLARSNKASAVLGFNEPDSVKQGNLSVQNAVSLWPQVTALGERVGSPATVGAQNAWSLRFHEIAEQRKLKVDFIAVHLYGPPDPEKFLQRVDAIHQRFGKPIWITEFAVADWTPNAKPGSNRYKEEDVMRFMKAVLPELERRSYVERYAWFGAGKTSGSEALRTSRLFDNNGELTPLGRLYASF